MKTMGYAAHSSDAKMVPYHFERRDLRSDDVSIEILYCGVCHSDLHTVNGDWGPQPYPLVPGHEIVGRVLEVGPDVKNYKASTASAWPAARAQNDIATRNEWSRSTNMQTPVTIALSRQHLAI